jgi:hypothetical protein
MHRRDAILSGLLLIFLGAWLLARNFGMPLPGLEVLWPIFPTLGGVALLVQYLLEGRRQPGPVFPGVALLLVGLFFFGFTLHYFAWSEMGRLWPVFILIGGVAFFVQWVAQADQRGRLFMSALALVIGGVALAATHQYLSAVVFKLWPLIFIFIGLGFLLGYVRSNRT